MNLLVDDIGYGGLVIDRALEQRASQALLQHFRREPDKLHMAGPISLWLFGGFPVERVEQFLETLAMNGVLRPATAQELKLYGCQHGYFVTPEGLASLPPEDRSYGVI